MNVFNIRDDDEQEISDRALLADVCGGISYKDAKAMGMLEIGEDFSSPEYVQMTKAVTAALERMLAK